MAAVGGTSTTPSREFSSVILGGAWPQTDPSSCDSLARIQQRKAQELLGCAEEARGAADRVISSQSGATIKAFHQTSYQLASTFTGHADRYFATSRASTECGRIMSGLRDDLDRIDAHAHARIGQLMRSATTGAAAAAARMEAIQVIVQARADATAASTAAAAAITAQGAHLDITPPTKKPGKHSAVEAVDFKQNGPGGDQPQPDPVITGPAAPPQHEQNDYDLQDQFQDGQGPTFGGDPRDGVPRSPASQLAQGPPGTRPLPTGTAIGPDGHRYGFFSNPDGSRVPGTNEFATTGSVWDFTDPAHPVKVGDLPGIFQGSGVYDPITKQMVIVGNTSNRIGDTTRGLWTSGPIDPAHPNSWITSLHRVGDVALPGDRESQLIALQGGGYALVGSSNFEPVQAITAATPQGLMGATPQTLITQSDLPTVYGPTVTGTSVDGNGLETIQLRVSTWPPGAIYDPNTWTTTFGVQH
jgi:hypothetical protein